MRDQRHPELTKLVRHAIDGDRRDAGVAKDDLVRALGGWVAVEGGLHILGKSVPQRGECLQEANHDRLGLGIQIGFAVARAAVVAERAGDLLSEPGVQAVDQVADMIGDVAKMQVLATSVAGVKDLPQVGQDVHDFAVAGQRRMAQVVDCAAFLIGLDDLLGDRGERVR